MSASQRTQHPNRRPHWLYRFTCDCQSYTGGIGRFEDGRIAEIFINGSKVGIGAETNAQDAAIVASLALQHGCRSNHPACIGSVGRLRRARP